MMAHSRQRGFRLWPWRHQTTTDTAAPAPPTAQELTEKLTELVHFERGVAALYYYLPDATLTTLAQRLCQSHQATSTLDQGVEHGLQDKDAVLEAWHAVNAIWHGTSWQPAEILATFGFRIIETWRIQHELWNVVVDPRAQFFGLAVTSDAQHRYWVALVVGQKGQDLASDTATAAR
jgi:hypothetical protein